MKFFIAFVSLLVLGYCQPPQPLRCKETPPKWHAHFREVDYDTGFFRFAEIDYDAENEQIHIREYLGEDEQRPTVVEEWFYFRDQKKYNISREQRCTAYNFYHEWHPIGIHDARFVGREWIGAEITTYGLEVDEFFDRGEQGEGIYWGAFAPITRGTSEYVCIPIMEAYIRRDAPFPDRRNIHAMFTNITATISSNAFEHCLVKH